MCESFAFFLCHCQWLTEDEIRQKIMPPIYMCGQLTATAHDKIEAMLVEAPSDLIVACPTFNLHAYEKDKMPHFAAALDRSDRAYNIPVYGPQTTEAVVRLIDCLNGYDDLGDFLGPAVFERNTFVINKCYDSITKRFCQNEQLDELINSEEGKERLRIAKERLRDFCERSRAFDPIENVPAWYAFVSEQLGTPDWKGADTMHVQRVLMLFGLTEEEAKVCAGPRFKVVDGKEDPTQRGEVWRALEWLTKMMSGGYGPAGATSDVVNLIYALEGKSRADAVAEVVDAFRERRLERKDISGLVLPDRMLNDGEFDDTLAWKLLHRLHRIRGTLGTLRISLQLPDFGALAATAKQFDVRLKTAGWLDCLVAELGAAASLRGMIEYVYDPRSKNAQKVVANPMWKVVSQAAASHSGGGGGATGPSHVHARTLDAGGSHTAVITSASGGAVSLGPMRGVGAPESAAGAAYAPMSAPLHIGRPDGETVAAVAASRCHAMAITTSGRVFCWGANTHGQLGVESEADPANGGAGDGANGGAAPDVSDHGAPSEVAATLPPPQSRHASNLAMRPAGPPRRVDIDAKVVVVACGAAHTLLVTENGALFSCGSDEFGQLGYGEARPRDSQRPRRVEGIGGDGAAVRECSAGALHSFAITASTPTKASELYAWGCSHLGRLGVRTAAFEHDAHAGVHTSHAYTSTPQRVHLGDVAGDAGDAAAHAVKHAFGGAFHSIALTEGGEVYTFGCSEGGRLGHGAPPKGGELSDEWQPRRIESLVGTRIVGASAGQHHSLLLTADKDVLTFGRCGCGELGHGDRTTVYTPTAVDGFAPLKATDPPTELAAGDHHSVVRTASGKLYWMGRTPEQAGVAATMLLAPSFHEHVPGKDDDARPSLRRDTAKDLLTPQIFDGV